jgi:hypothetical protein
MNLQNLYAYDSFNPQIKANSSAHSYQIHTCLVLTMVGDLGYSTYLAVLKIAIKKVSAGKSTDEDGGC